MDRDLEREIDRILGSGPGGSGPAAAPERRGGRLATFFQGRRLLAALILAIVEVVALIVAGPGLLGVVGALLVLALAAWAWLKLRPGGLRDVVGIVALAQVLVVAVPLAIGVSVGIGLIVGVGILVALAVVVFRAGAGRRR